MTMIVLEPSDMKGEQPNIVLPDRRCWAAGGAVRRWFTGEKQESDIDVFCEDEEAVQAFIDANGLRRSIRLDNANMLMFRDSSVQLHRRFYRDMEDTITQFDFAHCQFAWNGDVIVATKQAILCALRKHLAVASIKPGYEIDTLRRAFKYARQGYWPCIGTIRDLARNLHTAEDDDIAKFDSISPERWD